MAARFPVAEDTGEDGKGFPYSVFLPVDNLARYWFERVQSSGDLSALGPVMHAIADAATPQHAAGCNGNFHDRYETDVETWWPLWRDNDPTFRTDVQRLYDAWHRLDDAPPRDDFQLNDWATRVPAGNWRMDQLITWVALNAYHEFTATYDGFRSGYRFDVASSRRLAAIAAAMGAHVLWKLSRTWRNNTTAKVPLAAPVLNSPPDGCVFVGGDRRTSLYWEPVARCAFLQVEIRLGRRGDGPLLISGFRDVASPPTITFTRPECATASWRVTVAPADGPCTHSAWRSLVDKNQLPSPVVIGPAEQSEFPTTQDRPSVDITMSWQPVNGATGYCIRVEELTDIAPHIIALPNTSSGALTAPGWSPDDPLGGEKPTGSSGPAGYHWSSGTGPANEASSARKAATPPLPIQKWVWALHSQQQVATTSCTLGGEYPLCQPCVRHPGDRGWLVGRDWRCVREQQHADPERGDVRAG